MSKKCINCGMELPDEASFCAHCATAQIAKQAVETPRRWRRKALIGCAALAVLAFCFGLYRGYHAPKTYEGGSTMTYADGEETYDLVLSFDRPETSEERAKSMPNRTVTARAGENWGVFSYFYAYPAGEVTAVYEEFMSKVESYSFVGVPAEGSAKPDTTEPAHMEDRAFATLAANAFVTTETEMAELIWTFEMKNGDTIVLKQELYTEEKDGQLFKGGVQVEYEGYQIGAGFSRTREIQEHRQVTIAPGEGAAVPAVIYVWKEGSDEDVTEEFLALVAECNVSAHAADADSRHMRYNRPRQDAEFAAAYVSDIMFDSDSGTNEIEWTIEMANGDEIELYQTVTVEERAE